MVPVRVPRARGQVAARVLGALVLALCLLSILGAALSFRVEVDRYIHPEFFLPDLLLGLTYGPFGAYVASRVRHPVGWATAVIGLGFAASAAAIQWNLLAADGQLGGEALSASVAASAWLVGALVALLVLPWLIAADSPTPRALAITAVGAVVALLGGFVKFLERASGAPPHALASPELSAAAARLDGWLVPAYVVLAIPGAVHLIRRRARAGPGERRALGWVLSSVLVLAVSYLFLEVGLALGGTSLTAAAPTMFVAQVMLLAATFALVVRGESWTVDLAISRSVVAALLGGVVVALYIVIVWLGSRALPMADDTAGLVAVAVVALGVSPLRSWVQRRVDDLVFGSGARVTRLLDDLGRELGSGSGDDLLASLAEGLRGGLRLRWVEIAAVQPGPRAAAGEGGSEDRGHQLVVPLHRKGVEVGSVGLTAPPGQRLDPRTVRVVRQLSGLVAISLELATANQALELARLRLLDVRQEERRLIRRELHDGLGPSLSGVTLALAAIGNTSALRPEDAVLLKQVCAELDRRADDVRQMARVLLPPALEVGRLEEALGDLAVRFTDDRFQVTMSVAGADQLPEQHQVAAYHIAAEGVRNAYRHAGAHRCMVRLGAGDDGAVVLEVEDDGDGVDPQAAPGVGLSSMRERAAELGGTFQLASGVGGAKVTVTLP